MNTYNFTMIRTYETFFQVDANSYQDAVSKLSEMDIYTIELEQCCVTNEIIIDENESIVNI